MEDITIYLIMDLRSKFHKVLPFTFLIVISFHLYAQKSNPFQFISPLPMSIMVSGETNIILRHSSLINPATIVDSRIKVEGAVSGLHSGEFIAFLLPKITDNIRFNTDLKMHRDSSVT